ncbi:hypothetical protein BpHYR1_003466 [Brachionus plicatilis]|uniref:Uncharacterized protein n=1 Tax=Brachionus plicatilis TaxID=10195 RepID=A0A3M7SJT0_BRAPC|nr:hypothetical protein BpHYR1_003466 [Brachionus plicatilis]
MICTIIEMKIRQNLKILTLSRCSTMKFPSNLIVDNFELTANNFKRLLDVIIDNKPIYLILLINNQNKSLKIAHKLKVYRFNHQINETQKKILYTTMMKQLQDRIIRVRKATDGVNKCKQKKKSRGNKLGQNLIRSKF